MWAPGQASWENNSKAHVIDTSMYDEKKPQAEHWLMLIKIKSTAAFLGTTQL